MKKLLVLLTAVVLLAACGAPKDEQDVYSVKERGAIKQIEEIIVLAEVTDEKRDPKTANYKMKVLGSIYYVWLEDGVDEGYLMYESDKKQVVYKIDNATKVKDTLDKIKPG